MSMTMRNIALVLACLTSIAQGRRAPLAGDRLQSRAHSKNRRTVKASDIDDAGGEHHASSKAPLKALTNLLLAENQASAFAIPGLGVHGRSSNRNLCGSHPNGLGAYNGLGLCIPQVKASRARQVLAQEWERERTGAEKVSVLVVFGVIGIVASLVCTVLLSGILGVSDGVAPVPFWLGTTTIVGGGGYWLYTRGRFQWNEGDASGTVGKTEYTLLGRNSDAPRLEPRPDVASAVESLTVDGVTRLNGVVPLEKIAQAKAAVNLNLLVGQKAAMDGVDGVFGNVLCRDNRFDLLLDPKTITSTAIVDIVQEALNGKVGEVLTELGYTDDAPVHEFAAMIADPNAPRQPVHPDTAWQEICPMITCFIALQDITDAMGPTIFLPKTQQAGAHFKYNTDDYTKLKLLNVFYNKVLVNTLGAGDVSLFDSRVMHAGTMNRSPDRRVIVYFTIADPRANLLAIPPGSIRPAAAGKWTLGSLKNLNLQEA